MYRSIINKMAAIRKYKLNSRKFSFCDFRINQYTDSTVSVIFTETYDPMVNIPSPTEPSPPKSRHIHTKLGKKLGDMQSDTGRGVITWKDTPRGRAFKEGRDKSMRVVLHKDLSAQLKDVCLICETKYSNRANCFRHIMRAHSSALPLFKECLERYGQSMEKEISKNRPKIKREPEPE